MDDLIPYRRRGAVGPSFLQLDSEDLRGLTSRFGIGIGMPRYAKKKMEHVKKIPWKNMTM